MRPIEVLFEPNRAHPHPMNEANGLDTVSPHSSKRGSKGTHGAISK
jgi:hypothetical protein